MIPLASEQEIQASYSRSDVAADYVARRFTSALHQLLHKRQVNAVQRLIDRTRPGRILEIAPGPARLTRDLRSSGLLVPLEFNESMIQQGRMVCGSAHWVRGNGFQLPFADSFDVVYSFRFVRHFHRADRQRLYGEIRRSLRSGGYFIMDAVNERISRPLREAHPEAYPIYDKLYRPDDLTAELKEMGFEIVELRPVQKHYNWQWRSQINIGPRANWLNNLLVRLLERLPARDGLEWIVTCRRA